LNTVENRFSFSYEYTDRECGSKYSEENMLNNYIIEQFITVVNYLKDSVSQRFSSKEKIALWVNLKGKNKHRY
jgi:hypothetical protein